jgi:hypothetical protein
MQRRRILVAMLALTVGLLVRPIAVPPAIACSCAMDPDPIGAAAQDPQQAVFTGVVQAPAAQGTPVVLTRWFRDPMPQPVVWLDNAGFEDPMGGSCGTTRPPANTEWIFAAYRTEDGKFGVNLCSTHAPLDTDQGKHLLQAAIEIMGQPAVPAPPDAGGSPPDPMVTGVAPIIIGLVALVGLLAGLVVAAGRRRA